MKIKNSHIKNGKKYYKNTGGYNEVLPEAKGKLANDNIEKEPDFVVKKQKKNRK